MTKQLQASVLSDEATEEWVTLHVARDRCLEKSLEHFFAGAWTDAFRLLHAVPAEDRVKLFLTVYIAQHRRTAPADWRGIIELPSKFRTYKPEARPHSIATFGCR